MPVLHIFSEWYNLFLTITSGPPLIGGGRGERAMPQESSKPHPHPSNDAVAVSSPAREKLSQKPAVEHGFPPTAGCCCRSELFSSMAWNTDQINTLSHRQWLVVLHVWGVWSTITLYSRATKNRIYLMSKASVKSRSRKEKALNVSDLIPLMKSTMSSYEMTRGACFSD